MKCFKFGGLLSVLSCSLVLFGAITQAAEASSDGKNEVLADSAFAFAQDNQNLVLSVADRLSGVVLKQVGGRNIRFEGFGSIEIDVPTQTVLLYWKENSEFPAEVRSFVNAHNAQFSGGQSPVQIQVLSSPFSAKQLEDESAVLAASILRGGGHFSRVGPRAGASGIHVIAPLPPFINGRAVAESSLEVRAAEAKLRSLASAKTRDLQFVYVTNESDLQLLGRTSDSSPWYGGGRVWWGYGGFPHCSSGFAVTNGVSNYLMVAGHCAPMFAYPQTSAYNDLDTGLNRIGFASTNVENSANSNGIDAALVYPTSNATSPTIFFNASSTASDSVLAVRSVSNPFVGMQVLTSGSYSRGIGVGGTPAIYTVTALNQLFWDPSRGLVLQSMSVASPNSGQLSIVPGDSGGPVYVNSSGSARAVGLISGSSGSQLVFTQIVDASSALQVAVKTQ